MTRRTAFFARVGLALSILVAHFLVIVPAAAQPVPAPPESTPTTDVEAKKAEANAAFERGMKLMAEENFDAALAEFLRSRELYPARGNTQNAALCLKKLGRYDEALDMFETLLREVPSLSPEDKQLVELAIADL